MTVLKPEYYKEALKRQKEYSLHPACNSVIVNEDPVVRYIIVSTNEPKTRIIVTIPRGTAHHEAVIVANVLQGQVKEMKYNVTYCIASQDLDSKRPEDYKLMGELTTILGMVDNKNRIFQLFDEFIGEDKATYEMVRNAAEMQGARLESIVVRAWYKRYSEN